MKRIFGERKCMLATNWYANNRWFWFVCNFLCCCCSSVGVPPNPTTYNWAEWNLLCMRVCMLNVNKGAKLFDFYEMWQRTRHWREKGKTTGMSMPNWKRGVWIDELWAPALIPVSSPLAPIPELEFLNRKNRNLSVTIRGYTNSVCLSLACHVECTLWVLDDRFQSVYFTFFSVDCVSFTSIRVAIRCSPQQFSYLTFSLFSPMRHTKYRFRWNLIL